MGEHTLSEPLPGRPAAVEPSHAVLVQAAEWFACLRDGRASAGDRAAWQTWLDAADEHAVAWQQVHGISRAFETVQAMPDPRGAADRLAAVQARLQRRRLLLGGAGLTVAGASLGWHQAWWPVGLMALAADERTATGEQRELVLADGSRLWLNTASAVNLRFDAAVRRVRLVAGEVFIETAADPARAFEVDTPRGRLRALGTRFNVRFDAGRVHLAVYEGAVEVRPASGGEATIVPAGRQVSVTDTGIEAPTPVDMAREAWIQGTLAADNISLGEVISELRRYRRGRLVVTDEVAHLSVYGNFPLHDPDRVLRMLASALPIRVVQPMPGWTRIERAR